MTSDISPICHNCYESLPFQRDCCEQCGQAMHARSEVCGRCIEQPPAYDACFCAFRYEQPIDNRIRQFKYSQRPELAVSLAKLLYNELLANGIPLPDLLIPVPIHPIRLKERGFNQASELARHLSKHLQIPYTDNTLIKHHLTKTQAGLSHRQRVTNTIGSFSINMQTDVKHAAIIDDVVTTGSTASEIAKILKQNGVDYVQVWGVAHTN